MQRRGWTIARVGAVVLGLAGPVPAVAQPGWPAGKCEAAGVTYPWGGAGLRSFHVPLRDGTRIAIDLLLPRQAPAGTRLPTMFSPTRYWRAMEGQLPTWQQEWWVAHGYAVVSMDVRGTGASFGTSVYPWSDQESRDIAEMVAWIAAQPWSNRRIVSMGGSYLANTAEMVALSNDSAVKAIIPRSSDFDMFDDLVFPNGVPNLSIIRDWGDGIYDRDHNVKRGTPPRGVRPVDDDRDGSLLLAAVRSHASNPRVADAALKITFRDDVPPEWGVSFDGFGSFSDRDAMERSRVPIYAWAGWLDAGVAYGQLQRFMTFSNHQRLVIGPWNHGINNHTDPFLPPETPVVPDTLTQYAEMLCFFDQYVNGRDNGFGERQLTYYTLNEGTWKTARDWPIPGAVRTRWYFNDAHTLTRQAPAGAGGEDRYAVDFEHHTGKQNRWWTQIGGGDPRYRGDVFYLDRAEMDLRLLTYTSEPLPRDIEVTGHPVITLHAATSATDGAFFVYLEDVDSTGRVTYITEGQMRPMHRKISTEPPPYAVQVPYHSLKRKDALPVVPGEVMELRFGLWPTSVLLKRGHRIRIAIGGADRQTFARLPAEGTPVITVHRSAVHPSHIELPVFERP